MSKRKDSRANKIGFIKRLAAIGVDLNSIAMRVGLYVLAAGLTLFLGGAYLINVFLDAYALAFYMTIVILVIMIQIIKMIRLDRERLDRQSWEEEISDAIYRLEQKP